MALGWNVGRGVVGLVVLAVPGVWVVVWGGWLGVYFFCFVVLVSCGEVVLLLGCGVVLGLVPWPVGLGC